MSSHRHQVDLAERALMGTQRQERAREIARVTWVGAGLNTLLALGKTVGGVMGHSTALVADGLHSLSDLLSDGVILVTNKIGGAEADENHPYGHGKFETVGQVVLALILVGVGIGLIADALTHIGRGDLVQPHTLTLWIVLVSIVSKEWLYHYTVRVARKLHSKSLEANAWHHRSDALSSVGAMAGIVGGLFGYPVFDAIAGVAVGGIVVHVGGSIGLQGFRDLTDASVEKGLRQEIKREIAEVAGVVDLHMFKARRLGSEVLVDVHVQVPDRISVSEGHQIAERVRRTIVQKVPTVSDVMVHIDPEEDVVGVAILPSREEYKSRFAAMVSIDGLEVVDVTLHYLGGEVEIDLHLRVNPTWTIEQAQTQAQHLVEHSRQWERVSRVKAVLELPPIGSIGPS